MSCADPSRAPGVPAARDSGPRILCAGIAVHDHIFRLERFPLPGSKTRARQFVAAGGGCAANAAVAIVRLGGQAVLASPLGGPAGVDMIGDQILAGLAREGVDCAPAVRLDGATSPVSAILVDASGERLIVNDRDERLSDVRVDEPERIVRDCAAVLADNRFGPFVLPLCRAGLARGLPVVLDGDQIGRAHV